jgi:hypothetical protein
VVGITVQASLKEALSGSEDKACAIAQPRANAFAVESGKLQGERVCCEAQDKSAHFARRVVRVCSGEREAPRRTRLLRDPGRRLCTSPGESSAFAVESGKLQGERVCCGS